MGTLTGNQPAIDGHCLHKLPTSCRLTATLDCCACQDQRPHAPTYQTYVDGIGMVSRGTRWQRYCWFCKEFWENRVRAEGVEPRLTKVPQAPDQTSFCNVWHDYRRGYKVVKDDADGSAVNEPVVMERPWRDVAPGFLPVFNQPGAPCQAPSAPVEPSSGPHISIEEALDSLVEADTADDDRQASLRRERAHQSQQAREARIRARHAPPSAEQIQTARAQANEAEQRRRQIATDLAVAEQEMRTARQRHTQLLQAQASARNMERVFGTREDLLREGAGYVSPLTSMFTRAYDRYRTAEEVRAAERASDANQLHYEHYMTSVHMAPQTQDLVLHSGNGGREEDEAQNNLQPHSLDDERIVRPPPRTDEEMKVSLACRICLQQVADTATLPCGHLVMCSYCAAIAIPTKDEARTQPLRRNANCPQCRKGVKRIARIYTA